MSYNPEQFDRRAFIVRGRGQEERDVFLPLIAAQIEEMTPCDSDSFRKGLSDYLCIILGFENYSSLTTANKKTIDNWFTETIGKILGLYYYSRGQAYISENGSRLLETNDHPQFYKNICASLQVPNGINKRATAKEFENLGISFYPCIKLLGILKYIYTESCDIFFLTKKEIAYFILNNLSVMRGEANDNLQIISSIENARRTDSEREINRLIDDKNPSYYTQHTNECLNLLEYANLVIVDGSKVSINHRDMIGVNEVLDCEREEHRFELSTDNADYEEQWLAHYGFLRKNFSPTQFNSLRRDESSEPGIVENITGESSTTEIGNIGEEIVYQYERKKVHQCQPDDLSRVVNLSNTRGIGYDIHSVRCDGSALRSGNKFIEVKTTKRVLPISSREIADSFSITRNEYDKLIQEDDNFWIYRVYLTSEGNFLRKIQNPKLSIEIKPIIKTYSCSFAVEGFGIEKL